MSTHIHRRTFLKLAAALAATPLAGHIPTATAQSTWQLTGPDVPILSGFDSVIQSFMIDHEIPAATFALTWQGKLIHARGFNQFPDNGDPLVVPTTRFRIASLTKPITATAILQLVANRLLTLESRVLNLLNLTPYNDRSMDTRWNNITVQQLLHHTAGFDRSASFDPLFRDAEIARALGKSLPISRQDIMDLYGRTAT